MSTSPMLYTEEYAVEVRRPDNELYFVLLQLEGCAKLTTTKPTEQ